MVGQLDVVDAVMLQGLHETGAVELVLGDLVGAIALPELFVQGMVHHVEFMGAGDAQILEVILLIDLFEGHFGGGIEVPKGAVEVKENMFVSFHAFFLLSI